MDASLPPGSPSSPSKARLKRPTSLTVVRPLPRSQSRMSIASKPDITMGGMKSSDDDARTAVKVAIRVRPALQSSDPGFELVPQRFRGSVCDVPSPSNISIQSPQGKKLFVFDKVFDEAASQNTVWDYISGSVDSFIKGYNVSVLAYGQSGAGKSYTMGTSAGEQQDATDIQGIIPRAATAIFQSLSSTDTTRHSISSKTSASSGIPIQSSMPRLGSSLTRDYELKATYLEIYNEQLRDLLISDSVPQADRAQVLTREDREGRIYVSGLTEVKVTSVDDLLDVLNFGSSIRQTDATAINAKSSRSHAVFSLTLVQKKVEADRSTIADKRRSAPPESPSKTESVTTTTSKLHFVDLAGSERLKNTGAQGDRAKEGISINAGLAALGKVIAQLSSRHSGRHIAYRDSKLTRMLQDSLGGNAITYMVACVNPAEFHLSETLNTLTYAQRARAIQSKPEIQQTLSDSDKNGQIERLKQEITFLRSRISGDGTEKRPALTTDTSSSKVHQLESQLLDMQETYQALSQRHERFIAELGKSTGNGYDESSELVGEHDSVARLKRSSSFAEAVETVVAEYEKTIQSLESSLHNTRSSLTTTETTLQERESKIAYLEAAAQQNVKRIQKLLDQEAHTEQYLQQLESQLEGVTSDEETTATLINGLRGELARAKENQSSTEGYVSALERRLAEAEEDHVFLKSELDRLEQVIDRQRTLNQSSTTVSTAPVPVEPAFASDRPSSSVGSQHTNGTAQIDAPTQSQGSQAVQPEGFDGSVESDAAVPETQAEAAAKDVPVSAQSQFMADKVEVLTQELFDLRGEHELTINDFDELRRKYALALQAIAHYEDGEQKAGSSTPPRRSDSFLGEPLAEAQAQGYLGRSLRSSPSACSSQSDSALRVDTPKSSGKVRSAMLNPSQIPLPQGGDRTPMSEAASPLSPELEQLRESHEQLLEAHREVLDQVGVLKSELQKSHTTRSPPPTVNKLTPLSRRKTSSQDFSLPLRNFDKANRAFASLRNIALDHFEQNIDVRQNFELQLNSIMSELHTRSEKGQQLEAEGRTLRQQLDEKATIIAGLTRERSSLKSRSSVDFSAVSAMRDHLLRSEEQIKTLQASHTEQEKKLGLEISNLKQQLGSHLDDQQRIDSATADGEIKSLQSQLKAWEQKHETAMTAMQDSETKLLATITELETALAKQGSGAFNNEVSDLAHQTTISTLQRQLEDHIAAAQEQAQKMTQLENVHGEAIKTLEQSTHDRQTTEADLAQHREVITELQQQVESQQALAKQHESSLEQIKATYAAEINHIKEAHQQSQERSAALQEEHEDALDAMEKEIRDHQATSLGLLAGLATVLGRPVDYGNFESQVKDLVVAKRTLESQQAQSLRSAQEKDLHLQKAQTMADDLQKQLADLKIAHEATIKTNEEIYQKELKSSRLVAELEDQLTSNYDHNRHTTKRLSQLQTEKHLQLQEALHSKAELEKDLEDSRARITHLESQLGDANRRPTSTAQDAGGFGHDQLSPEAAAFALARSASPTGFNNSSSRHRASPPMEATALPSPPPTMPLPPLPGSPSQAMLDRGGILSNRPLSPTLTSSTPDPILLKRLEETESRIRTVEKHLYAEKQLTATLEEALVDLETAQTKTRQDLDGWRKKAIGLEDELIEIRKEREQGSRASSQTVEAERELRMRAEQARRVVEERMKGLEMERRRKKKGALNCF